MMWLAFLAKAGVLIVSISLAQLMDLVFRNPMRPAWLRRDGIISGAAFVYVAMLSLSVGLTIHDGLSLGLGVLAAVSLTTFIALVSAFACWRVLDIGVPMRRAEAGQSPFPTRAPQAGTPSTLVATKDRAEVEEA